MCCSVFIAFQGEGIPSQLLGGRGGQAGQAPCPLCFFSLSLEAGRQGRDAGCL